MYQEDASKSGTAKGLDIEGSYSIILFYKVNGKQNLAAANVDLSPLFVS